ncbi:hypothetical protein [Paenibacillus agricola]|uniref:Uncharacterized protein n=1 Tax=Paenibacillus agricola TaxID=2716264 RepID=A0ABX0JIT4_9BACL|nr:hypothetical protein [Paenibacillus agricola]NHN35299.1 hypothetical protein [Paenibacillus agricola]
MVNNTEIMSKEEAMEILDRYIKGARELKQLEEQHNQGLENNWEAWTEIKDKFTILTNDIKRHYEFLSYGETYGVRAAFFETAIKDIYVSMVVLDVDTAADNFLEKLPLLLIEIEGYAHFWLPQSI